MKWIATAISAFSLIAALEAQIVSIPDANAGSGTVNIIPLGGKAAGQTQDVRTQILVPKAFLSAAGSTIRELAFASASIGGYRYSSFRVQLAHLPAARQGTLSTVFADNLDQVFTVLDKTGFRYDFTAVDAWHPLGLTQQFRHDGKRDLVVDIVIRGAFFDAASPGSRRSSTLETVYALGYDGTAKSGFGPFLAGAKLQLTLDNGSLVYVGTGCKAANAKVPALTLDATPVLGGKSNVHVDDVAASLAVILFFGTSDQAFGALRLPFALDALGAASCTLRSDALLIFASVADASGRAAFPLAFPSDQRLKGLPVTTQALVLDAKANALGIVLSRLGKAQL